MSFRLPCIELIVCCAIAVAPVSAQNKNLDDIRHKAEAGDANAQFHLAQTYMEGKDVAKDPAQGLAWLQKSADQGYVGAEFALAYMYLNGAAKLPKDPHKAADWFRKAAKQQNKASQDALATMLAQGLISAEEANWREAGPAVGKTAQPVAHASPGIPKQIRGRPAPFSLAEVETGITGGITSKRMATLVQQFGVDFKLSSITRKRLTHEGADDNLLTTISAARRNL
jgi:Sel1 repeat-containing protein